MQNVIVQHPDFMFRAFSDRTRLRILHLLQEGELCVCDLVATLELPQPMISRHLAYLRKAGLVAARKEGLWMHYRLMPPAGEFHQSLLNCLQHCFKEVPELVRDTRCLKSHLERKHACCVEGRSS